MGVPKLFSHSNFDVSSTFHHKTILLFLSSFFEMKISSKFISKRNYSELFIIYFKSNFLIFILGHIIYEKSKVIWDKNSETSYIIAGTQMYT